MEVGYLNSPLGLIRIGVEKDQLVEVAYVEEMAASLHDEKNESQLMIDVKNQLSQYFEGSRKEFDLKYRLKGTKFQVRAWKALGEISYGETISYKEQALKIDNEKAVRAVGGANGKNRINIIIPCHRVIGSNGNLTGYGGGLDKKLWLLEHERRNK